METQAQPQSVRLKIESLLIKVIVGLIFLVLVIFGLVSLKTLS